MKQRTEMYRYDIDVLKGIAILSVLLYHMGLLPHGYLGVDIFLVINGFLIIPSIYRDINNEVFNYFSFLKKRFLRLAPLVIIACSIAMLIGLYGMLPDDYENLAESSVASLLFCNNILSKIIATDYWNVVNDYKPLMHLWYVGIITEFYIFFPFVAYLEKTIQKKVRIKVREWFLFLLTLLSIILYLNPNLNHLDKFYLLPCRFFEFGVGGICALYLRKDKAVVKTVLLFILLVILIMPNLGYGSAFLLTTVIIIVIILGTNKEFLVNKYLITLLKPFSILGKASYSIFIFHQIILAFYRYYFSQNITVLFSIVFIILMTFITFISYKYIEKKVYNTNKTLCITIISSLLVLIPSFMVYLHAGVVRDVPELDVYKDEVHRNMHAEYVDRIYSYDNEFYKDDKIKVLCIGNSFARDWANILLESEYSKYLEISYSFNCSEDILKRINDADYIFVYLYKTDLPNWFWNEINDSKKVYGIGNKNFGTSNGIIYARRFSKDYFNSTVAIKESFFKDNELRKSQWKENYIDLLEPITLKGGKIRVFSDNHKFLSQDCSHLTKQGALFYAKRLNLSNYIH